MTDTVISKLNVAAALGGAEIIPIVQNGSTVRITVAQLAAFIASAVAVTTPPAGGATATAGQLKFSTPGNSGLFVGVL